MENVKTMDQIVAEFNGKTIPDEPAPIKSTEKPREVKPGVFLGTIRQFVDAGLKYKDKPLDIVSLSTLCRIGMFQTVGNAQITKGRASAVYLINTKEKKEFTF